MKPTCCRIPPWNNSAAAELRHGFSRYLTLLLVGPTAAEAHAFLADAEALRQRIGVQYHLEGLTRDELDAYPGATTQAAGVSQPCLTIPPARGCIRPPEGIRAKSTTRQ